MQTDAHRLHRLRQHNRARLARVTPAALETAFEEIRVADLALLLSRAQPETDTHRERVATFSRAIHGCPEDKFVHLLASHIHELLELQPADPPAQAEPATSLEPPLPDLQSAAQPDFDADADAD